MPVYRLNSVRTIAVAFQRNGQPFTPTLVTLTVKPPTGAAVVLTKPSSPLIRTQPGTPNQFYYDIDLNERGTWVVEWLGTGTYVDGNGDNRPFKQPVTQKLRVYF